MVVSELIVNGQHQTNYKGKIISNINLNGVDYNFAERNVVSGGASVSCENAVKDPIYDMQMYGNCVQDGIPTPTEPIEVQEIGIKTHNLYDEKKFPLTDNRYISHINGHELSSSTNLHKATGGYIPIEPNKTYSINYLSVGDSTGIAFYAEDYTFISGVKNNVGFTTPSNAKYIRFTVPIAAENVQLNEGATILDYEPFGYKIPVKATNNLYNKHLYPLKKNIYIVYTSGAVAGSTSDRYKATEKYIPIEPNTTYTINYSAGGNSPGIAFYDDNLEYVGGVKSGIGFTTPNNAKYLRFTVNVEADDDDIQIMKGTTPIETVITNIYVYEPLRKVGDYTDYIDFKNKKVFRNIAKVVLKDWDWQQHTSYSNIYSTYKDILQSGINPLCNVFDSTVYMPAQSIGTMKKDYCIKMHATSHSCYVSDSVHTTISDFVSFIESINAYIVYVVSTPTEETIELPKIETLKGTTILDTGTNIKPTEISVEYWKQIYKNEEIIQTDGNLKIVGTGAQLTQAENVLFIGE